MSNIEIIMRQTNYSKEEAEEKLKKHNNDVMKTIEEYINYDSSQNENVKILPGFTYKLRPGGPSWRP